MMDKSIPLILLFFFATTTLYYLLSVMKGRPRGVIMLAGAKLQGRQVVMSAKRDNYLLSPRPTPASAVTDQRKQYYQIYISKLNS